MLPNCVIQYLLVFHGISLREQIAALVDTGLDTWVDRSGTIETGIFIFEFWCLRDMVLHISGDCVGKARAGKLTTI